PHDPIRAARGHGVAVRAECHRVERRLRDWGTRNLANALFFVIVDLLLLFGFTSPGNFAHELAQLLRHVVGVIVTAHEQLAGAILAGAAGNALAIGSEPAAEDRPRIWEKVGDDLGVV